MTTVYDVVHTKSYDNSPGVLIDLLWTVANTQCRLSHLFNDDESVFVAWTGETPPTVEEAIEYYEVKLMMKNNLWRTI